MGWRKFVLAFLLLSFTPEHCESANILISVLGVSGSQNLIMYRLAEIMGQRGHNVTVMKAEFFPEAKSIPLKYAKEIKYTVLSDPEALDEIRGFLSQAAWVQSESMPLPFKLVVKVFKQIQSSCETLLKDKKFIQALNDSNFDVIIIHMVDFCTFGLTQVLNVDSYVWMSTAMLLDPMAWYSASPLAHSYLPNPITSPDDQGRLSFWNRLKNLLTSIAMISVFKYAVFESYTEMFRNEYGPEFPHFDEIVKKTQLYFANSDPIFEYARPVSPNVINVGGLTMKKPEPLTEKWQFIMDSAPKEGVVIFSLGSIVNTTTMPQEIKISFLNAFKRFPHFFIWRFEGQFAESKSVKNLLVADWLPQKDLMAHPNTKAAIIHGGYNSLTETTYSGIPVIVLPLAGDQYGNAIRVTRQNIGVKLDRTNLNEQKVYDALHAVLYNETIQENAKRIGQLIREKPFSSMQQAIEWLEYLAKFKRLDQLQPKSHELYLAQYLLLDVGAFIFLVLISTVVLIAFCFKCCMRILMKEVGKKWKRD